MDPSSIPALQLTGRTDLASLIPYLLGHHPSESLILCFCDERWLQTTVRVDLDAATPQVLVEFAQNAARDGATVAHVIGYGSEASVSDRIGLFRLALAHTRIRRGDCLRITDGRLYDVLTPALLPPDGVPLQFHTPGATWAIAGGMVAFPDREALARQIAPTGPAEQTAMARAVAAATDELTEQRGTEDAGEAVLRASARELATALALYADRGRLSDHALARLTLLLTDTTIRDHAFAATEGLPAHLALWNDVTRRARPHLVTGPACLLAVAALLSYEPQLSWIALDQALAADPRNDLATRLRAATQAGMSPRELTDLQHIARRRVGPVVLD